MSLRLEDIIAALGGMEPEAKAELVRTAVEATKHLIWVPNPGFQQMAIDSEADELFFGGEPGGGQVGNAGRPRHPGP